METQPGWVNWSGNNNVLDKGEVRAMAWNDIGHGADAVAFWQWRSALNGQEQYHGVLVGADGTPVPVYDEAKLIGAEFEKAAPALAGTTVDSQVASCRIMRADGRSNGSATTVRLGPRIR
jgi:beta-galactosidase